MRLVLLLCLLPMIAQSSWKAGADRLPGSGFSGGDHGLQEVHAFQRELRAEYFAGVPGSAKLVLLQCIRDVSIQVGEAFDETGRMTRLEAVVSRLIADFDG